MPVEMPTWRAPTRGRAADGRIAFHPQYEPFLRQCGVTSAAAALGLRGEIVCGHPDRHVARVELHAGTVSRVVYLKREHVVGVRTRFRNARAGFGWVSRAEREAVTLRALEAAGLSGPRWLAYGEDGTGRAFLMVDELTGSAELAAVLGDGRLSATERRAIIERTGLAVAALHAAGFGTPDLAAKHVFVNPHTLAVNLIDWQSAGPPAPVSDADRVRQLAGLHASLGLELATPRERLRFLRSYRRQTATDQVESSSGAMPTALRGHAPSEAHTHAKPWACHPSQFARAIDRIAAKVAPRSTIRDQLRRSAPHLVWLADEAVCAIPEVAAAWPTPAVTAPFYADSPPADEWVTLSNGRRARLVRFRTTDPTGRLIAAVRECPWRSPAANAARLLFHLDRCGIDAPKLLAFGQRFTSAVSADSFVLYDPPDGTVPWHEGSTQWTPGANDCRLLVATCGALLRRLHDAGCRIVGGKTAVLGVREGSAVAIASPFAVRLTKQVGERARRADLRALLRRDLAGLGRTDRCRLAHGYLGSNGPVRKALLAALL